MGQTILTDVQQKTLKALTSDSVVSHQFYLSGGTALAAYYLHHRLSEDLDFFSEKEVDALWLTTLSQKIQAAISASSVDIQQSFNRHLVFFTIGDSILKTEFTYFPFSQIEKPRIAGGLRVDSLKDIAVNKFFTIYQKPASRHFIDLYCILHHAPFLWEDLMKLARIKFDTVIDPLQLGTQLMTARTIGQLPNMVTPLNEAAWRGFFLEKAKGLKNQIGV